MNIIRDQRGVAGPDGLTFAVVLLGIMIVLMVVTKRFYPEILNEIIIFFTSQNVG